LVAAMLPCSGVKREPRLRCVQRVRNTSPQGCLSSRSDSVTPLARTWHIFKTNEQYWVVWSPKPLRRSARSCGRSHGLNLQACHSTVAGTSSRHRAATRSTSCISTVASRTPQASSSRRRPVRSTPLALANRLYRSSDKMMNTTSEHEGHVVGQQ